MVLRLYESHQRRNFEALSPQSDEAVAARLPVATTAGDVREIVQYLKRKPAGVNVAEESDRAKRKLFEPRKLAAYELLGIVVNVGGSVSLSPLGWKCAREIEPETRVFRHLLGRTEIYWATLEWVYRQGFDVITTTDLVGFWRERHADAIDACDAETAKCAVVSFFNLCQAAELGTMTLGKRGHTTRLCVEREELRSLFETPRTTFEATDEATDAARTRAAGVVPLLEPRPRRDKAQSPRMLVLAASESGTASMLRRTLELANVECRLVEKDWSGQVSFDEERPHAANECDGAFVVLDEAAFGEDDAGRRAMRDSVLIEIGAALVLYNRRVVLLLDEKFPAPEAVRGLPCHEIVQGGLTWQTGIRLLEAVERFKLELGTEARR